MPSRRPRRRFRCGLVFRPQINFHDDVTHPSPPAPLRSDTMPLGYGHFRSLQRCLYILSHIPIVSVCCIILMTIDLSYFWFIEHQILFHR